MRAPGTDLPTQQLDLTWQACQADLRKMESVFRLFGACHGVVSRDDFLFGVYPRLKELLPHQRFVCGIANIDNQTISQLINVSFPDSYLKQITGHDRRVASPLVRTWLATRRPVLFKAGSSDCPLCDSDANWKRLVRAHGLGSLAAHGLTDISGNATTYFCFAGVDTWDAAHQQMMGLIVPHLHVALMQQAKAAQPTGPLLSPRELETLRLVCSGKTNYEISRILGISPWTVKIHVRNFMAKLEVSKRGQAVAKAMQAGLISAPRA